MSTCIMLGKLTSQAKRNPTEALRQRDQLWAEFSKKGVKVTSFTTLGPYDIVNLIDAPSDEVALEFLMAAGALGNVDSTTLRAFTAAEMEKIRRP